MSRVESKLGVQLYGVYRHYKNGREYVVVDFAISSTNGDHNGEVLVLYRRLGGSCIFARLESEFAGEVPSPSLKIPVKRFLYMHGFTS